MDFQQIEKLLNQNQQKNQLDLLNQKNTADKQKIDLINTLVKAEKDMSDIQIQQSKTQADILAQSTQSLGVELDNKQKKATLLSELSNLGGAGGGEPTKPVHHIDPYLRQKKYQGPPMLPPDWTKEPGSELKQEAYKKRQRELEKEAFEKDKTILGVSRRTFRDVESPYLKKALKNFLGTKTTDVSGDFDKVQTYIANVKEFVNEGMDRLDNSDIKEMGRYQNPNFYIEFHKMAWMKPISEVSKALNEEKDPATQAELSLLLKELQKEALKDIGNRPQKPTYIPELGPSARKKEQVKDDKFFNEMGQLVNPGVVRLSGEGELGTFEKKDMLDKSIAEVQKKLSGAKDPKEKQKLSLQLEMLGAQRSALTQNPPYKVLSGGGGQAELGQIERIDMIDKGIAEVQKKLSGAKDPKEKQKLSLQLEMLGAQRSALIQNPPYKVLSGPSLEADPAGGYSGEQAKEGGFLNWLKGTNAGVMYGSLYGGLGKLLDPANRGENLKATEMARDYNRASDDDIARQLDELQAPAPAQAPAQAPAALDELVPSEPGEQTALPDVPVLQTDQPLSIPPAPGYQIEQSLKGLDELDRKTLEGIKFREDVMQKQVAIKDSFLTAQREWQNNIQKNVELQRRLTDDPPSYKKALANVHWTGKVMSILDAMLYGHLPSDGTTLLDELVAKELSDQTTAYKEKLGYLAQQKSMYSQFLEINKDSASAESATLAMLYKGVSDQIDSYSKLATNAQQKEQLRHLKDMAHRKAFFEDEKFNLERKKVYTDIAIKNAELAIKKQELAQGPVGGGLKPTEQIDRRVRFGDVDYYDIPKDQLTDKQVGVRRVLSSKRQAFRKINQLEAIEKKLTPVTGAKALLAVLPGTKIGEKEKRAYDTLNKNLIDIMLTYRITFSGGGNMSNQEQKWLRQFFEVKESSAWTGMDAGKRLKILKSKESGEYTTLFKLLKKSAEGEALTAMEKSPTFNMLPKSEKLKQVKKYLRG